MIPASINISFDKGSKEGDKTVVALIRGTKAERMRVLFVYEVEKAQDCTEEQLAGDALMELGEGLASGRYEWSKAMADHGLPDHMLRVVVELDNLTVALDALNAFVARPMFKTLAKADQDDLLEQQDAMSRHVAALQRRLQRSRDAIR